LSRALAPWPLNLHHVSNVRIQLRGDRARSSCYFHAPMGRVEQDGSQLVLTNGGYYHDDFVRTDAGWRIQSRVCEQTMMVGHLPEGYEIPQE
jgi:3-phenylpropionate/cinnamic acid dioxygenase small subunit